MAIQVYRADRAWGTGLRTKTCVSSIGGEISYAFPNQASPLHRVTEYNPRETERSVNDV